MAQQWPGTPLEDEPQQSAPAPTKPANDPYAEFPVEAAPDRSSWAKRADGSAKGDGFLGLRKRPDGSVSSELSVGVNIDGKEVEVPTMVPGLSAEQMRWLMTTPPDQQLKAFRAGRDPMANGIMQLAVTHAKGRISAGQSPFKTSGEGPAQQPPATSDEPWDPLGQGDIGFAVGNDSRPPGSEAYVHAVTQGILNGTITKTDDVIQIAARFGIPPESWDAAKRKEFDDHFEALRKGAKLAAVGPMEYATPPIEELRKDDILPEKVDAFARGAVPLGLGDELDAGIKTLSGNGMGWSENLHRAQAINHYDEENNFYERLGGEIVGNLALPSGVAGEAKVAAKIAIREGVAAGLDKAAIRQLASSAARRAATIRMTKEGAAFGGAYGAGSTDGNIGDRALGAAEGASAGAIGAGALGHIAGQVARILPTRVVSQDVKEGRALVAAADRQGIDVLPADAGGPMTRRATSVTAQSMVGGQPIIHAAERMGNQAAAARDRVASAVGQALDPEAAGQQAISGARTQLSKDMTAAGNLFRMVEGAAADTGVTPTKALQVLDSNIAELEKIPGGSAALSTLQSIRADLAKGDHSVAAIGAMRGTLRDAFVKDNLIGSDIERRVNQVLGAAQEDVTDSLIAAGKGDVAKLYARANAEWRAVKQTEQQVLAPIIGTPDNLRSGEQVVKTLMADMQGNNARAIKFLNAQPPAEQANLRASIIGALGRAPASQSNAVGDLFSLQTFLTQWNKIGESAKAAYFGPEARAALNDLAKVAQGAREAAKYANRSNTGGVIGNALTGATLLGGIATFGKTIATQYALGRLLASPRFARWLARAPKSTMSAPAYIDRLSRIARAEPAIANDVLQLQQRLTQAFGGGSMPARLAADEPFDSATGIQENGNQQESQYPGEELPQ